MMKTVLLTTCKRIGKKPGYYVLFLFMLFCMYGLSKENRHIDENRWKVGYLEREDDFVQEIGTRFENINKEQEHFIEYIAYSDEQELKKGILKGEILCGIIWKNNLEKRLQRGDYGECITILAPDNTPFLGIIQENIFKTVYEVYSAHWYVENIVPETIGFTSSDMLENLDTYYQQGKLFQVEREQLTEENGLDSTGESASAVNMRGLLAFAVFMAAIMGLLDSHKDKGQELFCGSRYEKKIYACNSIVPIILAGAIMLLSLVRELAQKTLGDTLLIVVGKEIALTIGYIGLLILFSYLLGKACPPKCLQAVIFVETLLTILCSPAFVSLGKQIPVLKYLGYLSPVTWYCQCALWLGCL